MYGGMWCVVDELWVPVRWDGSRRSRGSYICLGRKLIFDALLPYLEPRRGAHLFYASYSDIGYCSGVFLPLQIVSNLA